MFGEPMCATWGGKRQSDAPLELLLEPPGRYPDAASSLPVAWRPGSSLVPP